MEIDKQVIILLHKGNSWYLPYTLWQLHQTNPHSPIIFIGDKTTKHFPNWITHIEIDDYNDAVKELRAIYRHKSKLGADFELTCIERWFILNDYMAQHQLDQCVYLDSDILVFENLANAYKNLPPHDMTWCSFSAHSNFISHRDSLSRYCDNVLDLYTNRFPEELKETSLFHLVISGQLDMNISDMTFFHDYNVRYPQSLLVVSDPNNKGAYDISMEDTRVFEDDGKGFKKIYWQGETPYGKVKETSEMVPFVTLHFQGKAKTQLKKHFKYNSLRFLLFKWQNDCLLFYSKIKKELA